MHKIILVWLLAVASSNAMAEWVSIGGDGVNTSYVDTVTIQKAGSTVQVWTLLDLKKAVKLSDGQQFLSWKTQYEFDCQLKQSRILAAAMYSENMGGGEKTNTLAFRSPKWEAVPANSNGEILWNYTCGKQHPKKK